MRHLFKQLTFLLLLISAATLSNASTEQYSELQNKALYLKLHEKPDWHSLLQYQSSFIKGIHSEIISPDSFFSKNGGSDPKAELLETIRAMEQPPQEGQEDNHPRCRFIARYYFLSRALTFSPEIRSIKCEKFEQWLTLDEIESVSLVFASGYFRNPASFFGHPILKFNRSSGQYSDLLDVTLNNGAVVPPKENPIAYVIKGVFGGYESAFSDTAFYQLNHSYAEDDLRDLWHYKLELSREEIKRLAYFSWEVLGQRFVYKFFSHNCSYFLENLLLYATGERISPRNSIYTVPSTTFFNLLNSKDRGRKRVSDINRVPSRQSKFREKFISLNDLEQNGVRAFVGESVLPSGLPAVSQIRVIDTLVDYYQYLITRAKSATKKELFNNLRQNLLLARLKLTKRNDVSWATQNTSTPPHSGSLPSLMRFSLLHNSDIGYGGHFRLRPVSYDFTDLDGGRVPNSKLNMFNTEFVIIDDKVRLERFDLVDISSVNLSATGLPGDGGLGWGLKFGLQRPDNQCLNCLVSYLGVSGLKGKQISHSVVMYSQLEGVFHSSYLDSQLRFEANVGLLADVSDSWRSHLKIGYRTHVSGSQESDHVYTWENRFGSRRDRNVTLNISHEKSTQITLGYGIYW